jgi:eukaryotic-like serine/threonine-protein kinase
MSILIDETLSHYRILAKIGEDATGTLYRAVDAEMNRPVALIVLAPGVTGDLERRRRIERDALASSKLQHPNIARLYGFSHFDGRDFAVMEAPAGESVYDLLDRKRPHRRDLLRFARQISSALSAAHGVGIVHGPLNPGFIFVSLEHQIKFHDFGFGVLDPPPESEDARRSFAGLSAPYISPEQVEGSSPNVRSDIFSFGVLLYHMTTRRRPFNAPTIAETWKAILEAEPKLISQITSRPPRGMDKLLERCLRKNPQRRFQDINEIEPLLEKMEHGYYQNPKHKVSFFWKNRRRIVLLAGMASVIVTAVAGTVSWWKNRSVREPIAGTHLRQITRNAGYDTDPVLSQDGSKLAYASDRSGDGNLDIWVQPTDTDEPRRLTSDVADDHQPAFSPNGETIAFRSERDGGGIYVIPTKGGRALLIAKGGRRPRFSPDGRWIAYWFGPPHFGPKPNGTYTMFVIPSSGGAPQRLRANFASCTYPIWTPDSKSLLFIGRPPTSSTDSGATDWWVASLDGEHLYNTGACRLFRHEGILRAAQDAIPGDWKGNNIFFSIPATESSNIWRASIDPGSRSVSVRPVRVTTGKGIDLQPFASSNGRVVFSKQSYNADIWGIPIAANDGTVIGPSRRWTIDSGADVEPSVPTDGGKLLFQSNRTGHHNLWSLDLRSGKPSPVMTSPQEQLWPLISPDGSKVAFTEMRTGRVEHFYKSISGGSKEVLCEEDCGPMVSGWSPDSRLVLMDSFSREVRSRLAISLIELPSLRKSRLFEDPRYDLHEARFSPDGRWIVFVARGDDGSSRLYLAPFHRETASPATEWVSLTEGSSWDAAPQWSPDGRLIYFASTRDGYRCIWAQRLNSANQRSGAAFAVAHLHSVRCGPTFLPFDNTDLFLGHNQILLSLGDQKGNIWSVEVSH